MQLSIKHINVLCGALLLWLSFSYTEIPNSVSIDKLQIDVDKYEVTIKQYLDFLNSSSHVTSFDNEGIRYEYDYEARSWSEISFNGSWKDYMNNLDDKLPVTMVSYTDACSYCESLGGRLPTDQEWNIYSGTEVIKGNIWHGIFPYRDYGNDGFSKTLSPVGSMIPLKNGLHDIYGNVWEYVQSESDAVIAKGGSFLCDFSMCSDTKRKGHLQVEKAERLQSNIGIRCVYIQDTP